MKWLWNIRRAHPRPVLLSESSQRRTPGTYSLVNEKTISERLLGQAFDMPALLWKKLDVAWIIFFVNCRVFGDHMQSFILIDCIFQK